MSSNANHSAGRIVNVDERLRHVLIVDDHALLAQSLSQILVEQGIESCVSVARSAAELRDEVASLDHCLVLLDLSLSDELGSGLSLIPDVLDGGAVVVMLTGSTNSVALGECFEAGVSGIIDKALPVERVVELIHKALMRRPLDPNRRHDLLNGMRTARRRLHSDQAPFRRLTLKECSVLEHLAGGLTAQEISESMYVSMSTVRTHIRSILSKLGVHSQLAAVALARQRSWLH